VLDLTGLSIPVIVAIFLAAAVLVWIAGTRLAIHGDELAERLDLAKEFVGLIFLAAVTELPEIVTTITAAQVENAPLVLGNMFGGITMQTAILAVADFFAVRYALTSWPRKPTHALLAIMLIVLLSGLLAVTILGDLSVAFGIGLGAICLSCGYPLVIFLLRNYDERSSWAPVDLPDDGERQKTVSPTGRFFVGISTPTLMVRVAAYSVVILVAGVALALSADALAQKSSIGSSFIGITLLAAATSMPELSTTLAAARIGAYTMAIANIFGSNLIMLALILPADIAYRRGPILAEADASAQFSIVTGIAVTAIYVAGILIRRTPSMFGAGLDSWLVMSVYVASLVGLYFMQ
jgi:cation:H+ antiporter